jgi:4-amino-4-deoxy-L-arabinose transferase-like glycosyltransferase
VGSVGFVASRWLTLGWSKASAFLAVGVLFVGPTLWSLGSVLAPGISMMPASDPSMLGARRDKPVSANPFGLGRGGPMESDPKETARLIKFLTANRKDETIFIAAVSSMPMAPIIIESGEPAVSLGGFMGADPALSKDQFIKMVEDGKLRFFLFGPGPGGGGPPGGPGGRPPGGPGGGPPGGGPGGGPPGMMANSAIVEWVREHGKVVDSQLWKAEPAAEAEAEPTDDKPMPGPGDPDFDPSKMFRRMRRETQIYDLHPELGLKPIS